MVVVLCKSWALSWPGEEGQGTGDRGQGGVDRSVRLGGFVARAWVCLAPARGGVARWNGVLGGVAGVLGWVAVGSALRGARGEAETAKAQRQREDEEDGGGPGGRAGGVAVAQRVGRDVAEHGSPFVAWPKPAQRSGVLRSGRVKVRAKSGGEGGGFTMFTPRSERRTLNIEL
jgi:hypothetical protein